MNYSPAFTTNGSYIEKFPWRFVAIAFGISWTCWFFVALTGVNIFEDLEVGIVAVLGGFGPAIAGILMVYRTNDQAFIQEYWRRVFDLKRIKPLWYLPVLLLYPATVLIAIVISGNSLDLSPLEDLLRNPGSLVTTLVFVFIFGPFSEELGWRDYALDWLQARYSALLSSIVLGVIWWAWHLPLIWVEGSFLNETGSDLVFLAGYLYTVILYSVLFTWVYNNNRRSVLAIILLHFSINLTSRLINMPVEIFVINSFVLVAIVGLIVWYYGGKRLVRMPATETESEADAETVRT
jgi:membrane protease YdiL (CAAX protease family)